MTDHQKHTFDCTDLKTLLSALIDDEIDDRDRTISIGRKSRNDAGPGVV